MQTRQKSIDELFTLAQVDPLALERYRQQQVQLIIEAAPAWLRQRLIGLQFTIDARRQLHKTPLGACLQLSQMMLESCHQLQSMLLQLPGADQPQKASPGDQKRGQIIAFPTPRE